MKPLQHNNSCGDSCCLRVQGLGVKVGNEVILENVSLHVHCGELVSLIGPNGAGKSTLLQAILGQREFSGAISFSAPGQRHRSPPRIGYVPQSPSFDPGESMTVADLFSCCMAKRPAFWGISRAMKDKTLQCLARVHGQELIKKRVGTLSGGELQRVLLALALEPLPNILILDEPLSGVDVEGVSGLMSMLDEIRKIYDLSILMTTHDFSTMVKYADQAVLIDQRILVQGKPQDVLVSPEFRRVFGVQGGSL